MVFVALSYINHLRSPAQVLYFLKKIPEIIQGGKMFGEMKLRILYSTLLVVNEVIYYTNQPVRA